MKRQEQGNFLLNSEFELLKSLISKQISKEENISMEAASTSAKQASPSPLQPLPQSPRRRSIMSPFHNISGSAGPPPPPPLPGSAATSFSTPLDQSTATSVPQYKSVIPLTKAKCKMREIQWVKITPNIVYKNKQCIWFSVWSIPPLQANFELEEELFKEKQLEKTKGGRKKKAKTEVTGISCTFLIKKY